MHQTSPSSQFPFSLSHPLPTHQVQFPIKVVISVNHLHIFNHTLMMQHNQRAQGLQLHSVITETFFIRTWHMWGHASHVWWVQSFWKFVSCVILSAGVVGLALFYWGLWCSWKSWEILAYTFKMLQGAGKVVKTLVRGWVPLFSLEWTRVNYRQT